MKILKQKSGMTLIEILLTSVIVTFVMLSLINLIGYVYKGVVAAKMQTTSMNMASEQLEFLKHFPFGGLNVTSDSCITPDFANPDLTTLRNCANNPYPVEDMTIDNTVFSIYKIVMYGIEDGATGNITATHIAELPSGPEMSLIKVMKVIVTYTNMQIQKRSEITSMVTDKDVIMAGIKISGWIRDENGLGGGGGHDANGAVAHLEGHPEYETPGVDGTGFFTIYNVLPGTYLLYGTFDSYYVDTYYAGNPIIVSATSTDITGIELRCPKLTPASISGMITFSPCTPPGGIVPESDVLIMANDGMSSITTSNSNGGTNFLISNIKADTTGANISITVSFFQAAAGHTQGAYTWVGTIKKTDTPKNIGCIQLVPGTSNTGIVTFKTINAIDRVSNISNVTIYLDSHASITPVPTPYSGITNASGDLTLTNIIPGLYGLTPTAADYIVENAPLPEYSAFAGINPLKKIYLLPVGKISGTIRDNTTANPIPGITVRVRKNFGAGAVVSEAVSNSLGAYLCAKVPAGNDLMVRPYLDGTAYNCILPVSGNYNNVNVVQGLTTPNKNFTLGVAYANITGTVDMPECSNNAVLVVAAPASNTQTPHSFSESLGGFYNSQNNLVRLKYPFYGSIVKPNGSFILTVPANENVDIFAYYNYISITGSPDKPTRVMRKLFILKENIAPGTSQTISGSWNTY